MILGAVYLQLNSDTTRYQEYVDGLEIVAEANADCQLVMVGDYNLPSVTWHSNPLQFAQIGYVDPGHRMKAELICGCFSSLGLSQLIPPHSSKDYSLDLLFGSPDFIDLFELNEQLVPTDGHHVPSAFNVNICCDSDFVPVSKRNFFAADYESIVNHLSDVDWDSILSSDCLDDILCGFYNVVGTCISKQVPLSRSSPSTYSVWYNRELIRTIRDKKLSHKAWKLTGETSDEIVFKRLRAVCIRMSRSRYRDYVQSVETGLRSNINAFWSFVNGLKGEAGIPVTTYLDGLKAESKPETVNLFSSHFNSVYNCSPASPLNRLLHSYELISNVSVLAEDLHPFVRELKCTANPGPDNVHNVFLKRCWPVLERPHSRYF
ncbi:uncharacterized protein LOC116417938 [Nasonia vitripennis]|uniref:Endonuclease/exonuclease/phosphatase domain-containing protein n=1 Tax=Nasonia vitripennis TaxID=7425 RepID=A0A7M7QK89_NASVI|nr:uncharacterized protein LOC116417938 [Nasonia vitripennis]